MGDIDLDFVLPCDVKLPPATTIKAGCTLRTLMQGIASRQHRKAIFSTTPDLPERGGWRFRICVGKHKQNEVVALPELLRLINGGAKIWSIAQEDTPAPAGELEEMPFDAETIQHAKSDREYVDGLEQWMNEFGHCEEKHARDMIAMIRWLSEKIVSTHPGATTKDRP